MYVCTYLSVDVLAVPPAIDDAYHQEIGAQYAETEQQYQGGSYQFSGARAWPGRLGRAGPPAAAVAQRRRRQHRLLVLYH